MEGVKEVKDWWYSKKINEFPLEELRERIKKVQEMDLSTMIVPIPYVGEEEIVEYKTDELIGLCPATGFPDIYTLTIKFVPKKLIPELKSFKMYLMQYLNLPISHEHLADKIYKDFEDKMKPRQLYLHLKVGRRGGIDTTIERGSFNWK